jgi:hypothetical protein
MIDDGAMDDGGDGVDYGLTIQCGLCSAQPVIQCGLRNAQPAIQCGLHSVQLVATSCSLQHTQLYSCTHGRVLYVVLYIRIIQTFYTHSSIALLPQGQGQSHSIQLLEVLPY